MSKTYRPYEPDQVFLLPPALTDWLPETHLVYFLRDVVEGLDQGRYVLLMGAPRGSLGREDYTLYGYTKQAHYSDRLLVAQGRGARRRRYKNLSDG